MEKQARRGKLIAFEGVEGSGKTTQIQALQPWLADNSRNCFGQVLVTREPGGTQLGELLRGLLLDRHQLDLHQRAELLLYAADRAQHVEEWLQPQLKQGAIILCDRFTDSTLAYQGYGRGLNLQLIRQLNRIATGSLESDLTLWLDVDVEIGLMRTYQRGTSDRMERAALEFHRRVQQGYVELAQAYPYRIARIDASQTPELVQQQIRSAISEKLRQWYPQLSRPS